MIQPILALFDPATDKSIETFSVTIGGLAAAVWYIKQLFTKNERVDATVRKADEFVHRDDFEKHVTSNVEDFRRVENQRQADLIAASGSRKATYEKIEETRKELGGNIDATRAELTDKIENMPDRVVAMLRNFGVIGK